MDLLSEINLAFRWRLILLINHSQLLDLSHGRLILGVLDNRPQRLLLSRFLNLILTRFGLSRFENVLEIAVIDKLE